MDRRTRFFWSLTIMAGVIIILFESYTLYDVQDNREKIARATERTTIGTDRELETIIQVLEKTLEARAVYEFDLKNNPLKLDKVVFLTDEQGRLINSQQANTIRVSGLYINIDPPKATVDFKNKEYTVTVGSFIEDHKVIKITKNGILVYRRGEAKFYPLQGRTLDPEDKSVMSRKSQYDNEEDY
ncbi:MAG: hypothetical protein L3J79_03400 [Candidatus Marinimicrobia bacterium]|nr:hypothetical protein [Candidatus Neomarinimicrobiota bacterium]